MRMRTDILGEFSSGHPSQNNLEGVDCGTNKGYDVRVLQAFQEYDLPTKGLRIPSDKKTGGGWMTTPLTYVFSIPFSVVGVDSQFFDIDF